MAVTSKANKYIIYGIIWVCPIMLRRIHCTMYHNLPPCHSNVPQGLVNVPIEHHPSIGDIISNRYLKVMWNKSPKRDIYQPLIPWENDDKLMGCHGVLGPGRGAAVRLGAHSWALTLRKAAMLECQKSWVKMIKPHKDRWLLMLNTFTYQKYHGFYIDPLFQYWIERFSMLNTIDIH